MILFPSKTKFKRHHKGRKNFFSKNHIYISPKFNFFGLKILEVSRIRTTHIETARRVVSKNIKKKYNSRLKILGLTDRIASRKSSGVRMGKGKGNFDYWYTIFGKGRILFELSKKIPHSIAKRSLISASKKLPFKSKFIFY